MTSKVPKPSIGITYLLMLSYLLLFVTERARYKLLCYMAYLHDEISSERFDDKAMNLGEGRDTSDMLSESAFRSWAGRSYFV